MGMEAGDVLYTTSSANVCSAGEGLYVGIEPEHFIQQ